MLKALEKVDELTELSGKKNSTLETSDKFKTYRKFAESNEKKLKEAEVLIEQLKKDINLTKEMEKNLMDQVKCFQNRLIQIHKILNQHLNISVKQQENEKTLENIEKKIIDLDKEVKNLRDKSTVILEITSNETTLLKQTENLKAELKTTQADYDLLKIELQMLIQEKIEMKFKYEESLSALHDELEKSKGHMEDLKIQHEATLAIYRKQIDDNQALIKDYENERKSLLEDFELPSSKDGSQPQEPDFVRPDSTVAPVTDDSSKGLGNTDSTKKTESTGSESPQTSVQNVEIKTHFLFHCTNSLKANDPHKMRSLSQRGKAGAKKPKTPLEFLSSSPNLPSQNSPPELPAKRRLFSTNRNHYLI